MGLCLLFTLILGVTISLTDGGVFKVGNPIVSGRSTTQGGTIYLLDEPMQTEGIIFAFSAYFNNLYPVVIMIYRLEDPVDKTKGYKLIKQWEYSAIKSGRREDIYLQTLPQSSARCFRIQPNDRLALYFPPGQNGSVAYDFAVADSAITLQDRPSSTPQIGTVTKFDALSWPYKFSVAAYLDTDTARYDSSEQEPKCFSDVQIPEETDGYENVGGKDGPVGATGPTGPAGATGPQGDRGSRGENGYVGLTGPQGNTGNQGPKGDQGSMGPVGPQGPIGSKGSMGSQGERGQMGLPGKAANITVLSDIKSPASATYEDCLWCVKFMSPYLTLGLVIWLALVTLIMFTIVIFVCCRKTPKASPHYQRSISNKDQLWKKYENGGFDDKPTEDNTYSAIEEGRTVF